MLVNVAPEEVASRGEFLDRLGSTHLPASAQVGLEIADWCCRRVFPHLQEPDVGVLVGLVFLLFIVHHVSPSFDGHLHVRLSGAEPHFAYHNVL